MHKSKRETYLKQGQSRICLIFTCSGKEARVFLCKNAVSRILWTRFGNNWVNSSIGRNNILYIF